MEIDDFIAFILNWNDQPEFKEEEKKKELTHNGLHIRTWTFPNSMIIAIAVCVCVQNAAAVDVYCRNKQPSEWYTYGQWQQRPILI